ncbi:glycosyltransferase [Microbacterium aurum]
MDSAPGAIPPRVTVCIAMYNGDRWIRSQLTSILDELESDDEVVVVDDASTDTSVDVVRSITDPRVRLIRHDENLGYVRTFEHALSLATRELVFLSDQDDLWVPGRRAVMLDGLRSHCVVASDLVLLPDSTPLPHPLTGRPWRLRSAATTSRWDTQVRIWAGIAPYFGCAMALRREFLDMALPFPRFLNESHDLWLATLANAAGCLQHVSEPTVQRRLHDNNASPSKPRGWRAVITARIMLLRCTLVATRRVRRGRAASRR